MIGPVTRSFITAKLIRLLGVLLDSRIPLLEALELTQDATTNCHYIDLVSKAREATVGGDSLSSAFADERLISPSVFEAIRNGEQTGQIGPLLLTLAEFTEQDNEVLVRSLTSILEPVILIFMGLLVGFVALSMFMPLFDLASMTQGV